MKYFSQLISFSGLLMILGFMNSCTSNQNELLLELDFFKDREVINQVWVEELNTDQVYTKGIRMPSHNDPQQSYKFSFKLTNNSEKGQNFYYKIFYQNESYKYSEFNPNDSSYNPQASENFYGSWLDDKVTFKKLGKIEMGEEISITDSVFIYGNPRNELLYYGHPRISNITDSMISKMIEFVYETPEWLASIEEKAPANKNTLEEQIYNDAIWAINFEKSNPIKIKEQEEIRKEYRNNIYSNKEWLTKLKEKAEENNTSLEDQINKDIDWMILQKFPDRKIYRSNPYKRNPRLGEYSFMLVVISDEVLNKLPESLLNIREQDPAFNTFINPYFYFRSKAFKNLKGSKISCIAKNKLKASISMDPSKGVYINPIDFKDPSTSTDFYTEKVGNDPQLYRGADFEQYFHRINKDYELNNVAKMANVVEEYTRDDYANSASTSSEGRLSTYPTISIYPGRTVQVEPDGSSISIVNPGNRDKDQMEKQNVGVRSRIGFSYGKVTAKIQFPAILSNDHVWNGVTCAFWLFSEDQSEWNNRDLCSSMGYLPKGPVRDNKLRKERDSYSEIDIEIVKTSKYWPVTSYGEEGEKIDDHPDNNDNLIVAATNWDLACQDPRSFHQGAQDISFEGHTNVWHRWDDLYQAVTSKTENPHDKTVGKPLYYQIEWKPTEIIWRIGEDPDNLKLIAYVDSSITKIPNNQMIAIMTQEFHYGDWWPMTPFDQQNIPFPLDDLKGYIYDIKIE